MVYLRVFVAIVKCCFCYIFSIKSNKNYYLAGKSLFALSFRYSDKEKDSFSFFLKSFVKSFLLPNISLTDACITYSKGGTFFFDIQKQDKFGAYQQDIEKIRLSHLGYFYKQEVNGSIWKSKLPGYTSVADRLILSFFQCLLFIFLFPVSFFKGLKGSLGLVFSEFVEIMNLVKIIKEKGVKRLIYYSIYATDSNVTAIILKGLGVEVIKVTSLTPLRYWNKLVIADSLAVSFSTQLEEVDEFRDTMLIKDAYLWGPEQLVDVIERYTPAMYEINKNTVGFYSTGIYTRISDGNISDYFEGNEEENAMMLLAKYLRQHPHLELIIFPHPRERSDKFVHTMKAHYEKYFRDVKYRIMEDPSPSAHHFELVNLGVAMYSSVIFERLYCGFKCLLIKPSGSKFILPGSLSNICVSDETGLTKKMDEFLQHSNHQYFKTIGIQSPLLDKLTGN